MFPTTDMQLRSPLGSSVIAAAGQPVGAKLVERTTLELTPAVPADDWVLTLDFVAPHRLLVVLSDGLWHCDSAEGHWPPVAAAALPEAIVRSLGCLKGRPLRLQLRTMLDEWSWEAEIGMASAETRPIPRFLTDLPETEQDTLPSLPLVVSAGATDDYFALIEAARRQDRPLVIAALSVPAAQCLALERTLRIHWRDSLLLSQTLALVLTQLDLPPTCCRLYGDGRARVAEAEQGWRPVTIMSIDLVGSTQLLRSIGAEAYSQRLQAYHRRCREVVLRFDGSLNVPQGDDGLMAYFGFPMAVEDAAARALTAAWHLSNGMAGLGLQVRIGVASGQLAVSAQQAFGPEVHLAARLRAAAQPGQILAAQSTRIRVGPAFLFESCGEGLILKDFSGQTAFHRLTDLRPPAPSSGATPVGSSSFVGRRHELHLLRKAWADACDGRMQWYVIHGEAGIGKSRLLQEFSRELASQGMRCLAVTGQAQSVSSPFAAVVDALRIHWAIDPDLDVGQLQKKLADLPGAPHGEGGDLEDLARLLVQSRGVETPSFPGVQRRWSELLLDCLQSLIEPGPCCLLVDDVHWLDPSSIELLRRLRHECADRPLLVVLGERADPGRATTLSGSRTLELQGLTTSEAHELARHFGAALPARVRQRVIDRAEGIPLYLEESLRMLSQRDAETDGDVPAKLEDLLMVRLDELGPDRALAQLVSVLGREFSETHFEALMAQDDPFVNRARQQGSLGSLVDNGLLLRHGGPMPGYRFKHALISDAAYGSIWTEDRKRLHGLCADLIEQSTPGIWRQRPEQAARHLEAADRLAPARRAWLAAAHLAATRHAHEETVELAQRALALHEQVPDDSERALSAMQLHLLLASAQIALRGYGSTEVEAAYQAAEHAGRQLTDVAYALRIRLGLEACYVMRGDLQRAAELAQEGVCATDWDRDARLALQSRWALANVRFHQGDWMSALAGFDDCLAHYQKDLHRVSGVQDPAIMCFGYSSWIHFELGHADEALHRIARMLDLAKTLQHPFSSGVALGFAASIKRLCGDIEGAWPHALEAVRICERGGFQVWLAHAWMIRGQLRCDRGDPRGGAEDIDRGYGLWVGGGARISCATYLATRAELLLREAKTERAAADLNLASQISAQIGEHYYRAELLRLQALCAWQAGDPGRAEQILDQALETATQQRKPGMALRCALSLGALEVAQGRSRSATQRLRDLLVVLPGHGSSRDARWARLALPCWELGLAFPSSSHTPWEPR